MTDKQTITRGKFVYALIWENTEYGAGDENCLFCDEYGCNWKDSCGDGLAKCIGVEECEGGCEKKNDD